MHWELSVSAELRWASRGAVSVPTVTIWESSTNTPLPALCTKGSVRPLPPSDPISSKRGHQDSIMRSDWGLEGVFGGLSLEVYSCSSLTRASVSLLLSPHQVKYGACKQLPHWVNNFKIFCLFPFCGLVIRMVEGKNKSCYNDGFYSNVNQLYALKDAWVQLFLYYLLFLKWTLGQVLMSTGR